MKRNKTLDRDTICNMAKHLEWGDTYYKIDSGSVTEALIEARYIIEHGMSSAEYRQAQYEDADRWMREFTA